MIEQKKACFYTVKMTLTVEAGFFVCGIVYRFTSRPE